MSRHPELARKTVQVGGIELFYLDSETPGPTILCLHGRFGRAETWLPLTDHYRDHFRIIAPDQRGHGLSSQPIGKYEASTMAQDAANLITHIGCDPVIVVGHSMGGRIAGYLAAQHPRLVAVLVVLDQTAHGPATQSTLPLDQLPAKDVFTKEWPLPFASRRQAENYIHGLTQSDIRTTYYLQSLIEQPDGYGVLFSQQATAAIYEYQEDWHHLLPAIEQPTLLVRANNSNELTKDQAQQMQQLLPHAQSVEVSQPDHHVYLSNTDEFYAALDRFLDASGYASAG